MGSKISMEYKSFKINFLLPFLFVAAVPVLVPEQADAQTGYAPLPMRQVVAQTPPPDTVCMNCSQPLAIAAPAPPASFDPIVATDMQLEAYGFPPRPNAGVSLNAYAVWLKVVSLPTTRIVPQLEATNVSNGPAAITSISRQQGGSPVGATSPNWSGYVDYDPNKSFVAPKTYVFGSYIVPFAEQAFGACVGTWEYSSQWVGIDGWGSNDVLQAGTEADSSCSNGTTTRYYSAWYEWYPTNEVRVSNLPVSAGDQIYVYVWNTSTTVGNYYMADETKNTSVSLSFTAPSGTVLQGNSVEWVVERTKLSSGYSTLANYVTDPWYYCHAQLASGLTYSPASAPTGTIDSVTMVENNANVSYADTSTNNGLTYINPQGSQVYYAGTALWFFDEGAAR